MEITGLRFKELTGTLDVDPDEFYEGRLSRPIDLYPEFGRETATDVYVGEQATEETTTEASEHDRLEITQTFVFVETDLGLTGVAGPISRLWARLAATFEDVLLGEDPRATERVWDQLYRSAVHGRKGKTMQAVSVLDCALWDLKGKQYDEPVYRLLGGPTREELPAYASMLGYSAEPDRVHERAGEFAERGYDAQKWFFRHGVGDGCEGKRRNLDLARAAREAVGEEYDLMFDCWMSWDRTYALDVIPDLAVVDPRWVEEPVQPDKLGIYAELREAAPFPIAGGEHEYTRWGMQDLLEYGAVDLLQPDAFWAGGLTELRHACSLASAYDVPVVPHGHSVPTTVHLVASLPATVCPLVEYLVKWNEKLQYFLADPIQPENGTIDLPDRPGLGIVLDESAIESRTVLAFD